MKRIHKIQNGIITFKSDKGAEVSGDATDCRFAGGVWNGTTCKLKHFSATENKTNANATTTLVKGQANVISNKSNNSIVIGNANTVSNIDSTVSLGQYTCAVRQGEFAQAYTNKKGRNQKSVLMFEGRTVNSALSTELFLGGVSGERFIVDESFNRSVLALDVHATFKKIDSTQATCAYMHSNACFQSTAGVLAIVGSHTSLFATSGISTSTVVLTATSGTPDYIKVHVVGDRTMTQDWSVIINVYELRTTAV
tara:strand:- start:139 stop:897 length:759 start_codon:yes stop_codon:yes gene_type:complete